jgi:hypothetical protein
MVLMLREYLNEGSGAFLLFAATGNFNKAAPAARPSVSNACLRFIEKSVINLDY